MDQECTRDLNLNKCCYMRINKIMSMKKLSFNVIAIALALILFNGCNSVENTTAASNVSFYEVPLVCGAAPDIGCGSKSKPVLLGLEEKKEINEAWLNRSGTIIAVVWNLPADHKSLNNASEEIFSKNKLNVKELDGDQYKELLSAFDSKEGWLRGAAVDQLSIEEAIGIAKRLIARINHKTPLSEYKSESLIREIDSSLIVRFTKEYSYKINDKANWTKETIQEQENLLLAIGTKYLDDSQMQSFKDALLLGMGPTDEEMKSEGIKNLNKACCKKEDKSG